MKRLFAVVDRVGKVIPKEGKDYFDSKIEAKHWRDAQGVNKKDECRAFVSYGPDHDRSLSTPHGKNKGLHPKRGKNQSQFGGKPRAK